MTQLKNIDVKTWLIFLLDCSHKFNVHYTAEFYQKQAIIFKQIWLKKSVWLFLHFLGWQTAESMEVQVVSTIIIRFRHLTEAKEPAHQDHTLSQVRKKLNLAMVFSVLLTLKERNTAVKKIQEGMNTILADWKEKVGTGKQKVINT